MLGIKCMVQLIEDLGLRWRAHGVQVRKRNVIHIAREGQDQVNLGGVQDQKEYLGTREGSILQVC